MNSIDRRAIVILGMHRSGTSALTRLLSLRGAALPRRLMPPVKDNNETGFWEPQEIVLVHDQLLTAMGSRWDDVRPLNPKWFAGDTAKDFQNRLVTMMQEEFGRSPLFVLKDPRICRLLPLWMKVFEQADIKPFFVLVARHPFEVVRSLHERDGFSSNKAIILWLRHVLEAERGSRGYPRSVVTFDAILSDWKGVTQRIANDLGIHWTIDANDAEESIVNFLTPSRRHHVADSEIVCQRVDMSVPVNDVFRWHIQAQVDRNISTSALNKISEELDWASSKVTPYIATLKRVTDEAQKSLRTQTSTSKTALAMADALLDTTLAEYCRSQGEAASSSLDGAQAQFHEQLTRLQCELMLQTQIAKEATRVREQTEKLLSAHLVDLSELKRRNEVLGAEYEALQKLCARYEADLLNLNALLSKITTSMMWRFTAPFRTSAGAICRTLNSLAHLIRARRN